MEQMTMNYKNKWSCISRWLLEDLLTIEENKKLSRLLYDLEEKLNHAVKKAMQEVNFVDLAKRQYGKQFWWSKRRC
jgi:hypothetical protein